MLVTCETCGKSFETWPSKFRRFCSRKCYEESRKTATMACKICGKKFKVHPSQIKRRKTCSKECFGKWRSLHPKGKTWKTKKCEVCGKEFHFYPDRRPNRSERRFCSNKCRGVGISLDAKRKRKVYFSKIFGNHRNFRRRLRYYLQEFSDGRCEICGWNAATIDICHIIPRKEGGEATLANVVFLCPNHHRMYDEGLIQREHLAALARKRQLDKTDVVQFQ